MNYKDKLILDIAKDACKKISGKVRRSLQKITDCLQSGDDSPLKNVWDEICVQVQYEESVMWEVYLDTLRQIIQYEVDKTNNVTNLKSRENVTMK